MGDIAVRKPDTAELEEMGVGSWPVWTKEVSRFEWSYGEKEVCYILEGQAVVEPESGPPVKFGPGDLVTFPEGLNCVWDIKVPIKKHYKFG